jgi:hypothetical protein
VWLALANGSRSADGIEHVLPELESLGRFADELRRRLAREGLDGIEGPVRLYRQLRETIDPISEGELERMRAEIQALVGWLEDVVRSLAEVRRLKRELG